jgi:hypothetical protein
MSGRTHLITERFALSGGTLDREAGVLRGAVICGLKSENGRDYEWGGRLKGKHVAYEGAVTNCDHGTDDTVERRFGWWANVRAGADGKPTGDFHMLKSHPMYERVAEAAEKNPRLYGFSHVIEAETRRHGGREIVESIKRVVSIDLVATPATTKSLFESARTNAVQTTLRAVIESARPKLAEAQQKATRRLLLLAEDDAGLGAVMDAPIDEPPADVEGGDAVDDAFKQLMHAQLDKLLEDSHSLAEFLSNIRELYKTRAKITGSGSAAAADTADDDTAEESRKAGADAIREALALLDPEKALDVMVVANTPKADRQKVADRLKAVREQKTGEEPRSAGRGAAERKRVEEQQQKQAGAPFCWQD